MKASQNFVNLFLFNSVVVTFLRLLEILLIYKNFGSAGSWIFPEIVGTGVDLLLTNALLVVGLPLYWLLCKRSPRLGNPTFAFLITILGILHLIILKYFLYQLTSLDQFLYQYPLKEVVFTIKTAGTSFLSLEISIALLIIVAWVSYKQIIKREYTKRTVTLTYILIGFAVIISISTAATGFLFSNKYIQNKPIFFYARSIAFFAEDEPSEGGYNRKDAQQYHTLFKEKAYVSNEYPLLHRFDNNDVIGTYFKKSSKAPNIVVLIIEGLNDDFIHTYKGVNIMPFLSSLKDKSLYWNSCFTLGERSFAVVPSILGGLPYGEKGFTLQETLPYHLSLVSVLKNNGYYASFFYGQGSWFHLKGRFFEFNNADLVFDNAKFAPKYKKIIVGDDNFFWGYNDKDLFNQSLEVIDTLPKKPRIDVYFTGTSHAPYVITDEAKYEGKIDNYVKKTTSPDFFKTYEKYLKAVFFADDALADFFNSYQKRADFTNTIFIITGDHPNTEIPRANSLKRYHVPLIIYSPLLTKSMEFSNIVSHLDIYETLLPYLKKNYNITIPAYSSSIGEKLITSANDNKKQVAFMDDNREIIDYYSNGFYIADNHLFKVGKGFSIAPINDSHKLQTMQKELASFKKTNYFASTQNRIIPDTLYCNALSLNTLFKSEITQAVEFNTEFHNLTETIPLANDPFWLRLSMKYSGQIDEKTILVYQLTNSKGSTILWNSCGFPKNKSVMEVQVKVPAQKSTDSTLFFKAYIWNQDKLRMKYSDLKILIHNNQRNGK